LPQSPRVEEIVRIERVTSAASHQTKKSKSRAPKKKEKEKNKNPNKKQQKSKLKQQKNVENPLH